MHLPGLLPAIALAGAASAALSTAPDRFEQVFATAHEPASLHYKVRFASATGVHSLEVWRDARHVKRITDGAVISFATRTPGDPGYALTLLDTKRRISTRIDRTNLYRIGNFTDWFDLTHGLRHPKGAYTLDAEAAMAGAKSPCRWYDLKQAATVTRICWDDSHALPLQIIAAGKLVWRVVAIDTARIAAGVFVVHDQGYTRNDANRDIDRD